MILPIDDALPELLDALKSRGRAVLQAPPGAGKTTRVPLAILEAGLTEQRIVMLEPRRLAARAAAERMAETLGEKVGALIGYRMRGEAKVSLGTRIEVVTEGVLTRMLQDAPDLPGIGAVIFDEFHERSLNADLGLALCLEVADALRNDLMLLAMSATLDAEPVAALMDAPLVTSEGRSFPVETRWLERPAGAGLRIAEPVSDLVLRAEQETRSIGGGLLVFLPGEADIRRVESLLKGRLPGYCTIRPLFGAMSLAAQRAAILPQAEGRKVVLTTSIAETSLTLSDIRVVVDGGLARRARFDPGSGMSRLVTERVSRAEAVQRQGRAGRVAEGICYRLWSRGEEGALAAFPPAEIEVADLAGVALELALWGGKAEEMPFLTQPNAPALAEAQSLLSQLGALDDAGRITPHGRTLAVLPLHPRLGHMLASAGSAAAPLAALLSERDPLRGAGADVADRLKALEHPGRAGPEARAALDRIGTEARRLERVAEKRSLGQMSVGVMSALAFPDRIGQRRKGGPARYVLSGGKGVFLPEGDGFAATPWIVALDTDGDAREAQVRLAAAITVGEIRECFADRIAWIDVCAWSRRDGRVLARRQERLGALVLDDRPWPDAPAEATARAMLDGVRSLGLVLDGPAARLTARVELLRATGADLPDMSLAGLTDRLDEWLLPMLGKVRTTEEWKRFDLLPALEAMLSWEQRRTLDAEVPAKFTTPLGRQVAIDYGPEGPELALRLQELFGVTKHPRVGGRPIRLTLLSPAQRPIQVTQDLPGFWAGSYADVRKEMRATYPRHPWPEDPTAAEATLRAKPRRA